MPEFSVHLRVDEWLTVNTKDKDIAVGAAWDQVFDKGLYDCDVLEVTDEQEDGGTSDQDGGVRT